MRASRRLRLGVAWAGLSLAAAAPVRADDDVAAAPAPQAAPEAAPDAAQAENPFAGAAPPVVALAPGAPPPIVHPQVNMAVFTREYRPVPMDSGEGDVAVRAALDRPIEGVWELEDASLRDAVRRLREALRVTVMVDEAALEESGIDPDEGLVTVRLAGMTGRAAMRVLLTPFALTFVAADEVLTITTVEKACERLTQVAYPLPRWPGANGVPDTNGVVDLIQNTIAAHTWDCVGGVGCIRVAEAAGEPLLVVSQTCDVHEAVERFMRAMHGRALAEFAAGRPVLKVHRVVDERARGDLAKRLKELCNANLGPDGDPAAQVTAVAATLVVSSTSPLFHALAAQMIAAVAGVEAPPMPQGGVMGMPGGL